jgi:hypothetical protein
MPKNIRPHDHAFSRIIDEFSEGWKFLHAQRSQISLSKNNYLPMYGKYSEKGSF